ncbi:hypothetical protein B0H17DRAFT_1124998 [Mycena rosella]|uniref:Uncharacterized protein n=1 Tax=Mycena rosella TaxID=1033263 RepID=A0AAD7GYM9_MYCRO|nr:hypothetical protein B0H17DRAFT_1124998 [Mycena rosella]
MLQGSLLLDHGASYLSLFYISRELAESAELSAESIQCMPYFWALVPRLNGSNSALEPRGTLSSRSGVHRSRRGGVLSPRSSARPPGGAICVVRPMFQRETARGSKAEWYLSAIISTFDCIVGCFWPGAGADNISWIQLECFPMVPLGVQKGKNAKKK